MKQPSSTSRLDSRLRACLSFGLIFTVVAGCGDNLDPSQSEPVPKTPLQTMMIHGTSVVVGSSLVDPGTSFASQPGQRALVVREVATTCGEVLLSYAVGGALARKLVESRGFHVGVPWPPQKGATYSFGGGKGGEGNDLNDAAFQEPTLAMGGRGRLEIIEVGDTSITARLRAVAGDGYFLEGEIVATTCP